MQRAWCLTIVAQLVGAFQAAAVCRCPTIMLLKLMDLCFNKIEAVM